MNFRIGDGQITTAEQTFQFSDTLYNAVPTGSTSGIPSVGPFIAAANFDNLTFQETRHDDVLDLAVYSTEGSTSIESKFKLSEDAEILIPDGFDNSKPIEQSIASFDWSHAARPTYYNRILGPKLYAQSSSQSTPISVIVNETVSPNPNNYTLFYSMTPTPISGKSWDYYYTQATYNFTDAIAAQPP